MQSNTNADTITFGLHNDYLKIIVTFSRAVKGLYTLLLSNSTFNISRKTLDTCTRIYTRKYLYCLKAPKTGNNQLSIKSRRNNTEYLHSMENSAKMNTNELESSTPWINNLLLKYVFIYHG